MLYSSSNSLKYLAGGVYNVKSYLNRQVMILATLVFLTAVALLVIRYESRIYAIKSNATYNQIQKVEQDIQHLQLDLAAMQGAERSAIFAKQHRLQRPHDWQIDFESKVGE
jgi:cell division protein FtsL